MAQKIVVVLQLQENQELYNEFKHLPGKNQIDFICESIKKSIEEVLSLHGEAPIFVTWRESALYNENDRFLDKNLKKYFKDSLKSLTLEYKSVTVFSGPITTIKTYEAHHEKIERLQRTNQYYKKYKNLSQFDVEQSFFHQQVKIIKKGLLPEKLNVSRVTGYCFRHGECIHRHDKITPYKDDIKLSSDDSIKYCIFQPGNKKNNSSIISLDEQTTIGYETCREHKFKILKQEVIQTKASIFLQLLLSDGAAIYEEGLCGKYALLVDSKLKTELIDVNPELKIDTELNCYSKDPFTNVMVKLNPVTLDKAECVIPPLLFAMLENDLSKFIFYLDKARIEMINKPFQGFYLLNHAVRYGHDEMVSLLLDRNADLDVVDADGQTPLSCAIATNNEKLVQILLGKGANPNAVVQERTLLSWAIEFDNTNIINLLVHHEASLMPKKFKAV